MSFLIFIINKYDSRRINLNSSKNFICASCVALRIVSFFAVLSIEARPGVSTHNTTLKLLEARLETPLKLAEGVLCLHKMCLAARTRLLCSILTRCTAKKKIISLTHICYIPRVTTWYFGF